MANQTNSLSHTKWVCKYHIVFVPKYRRKIIYNQYRRDLQEIIRTLCKYKGVEILEGNMMPDHVHLLISIPPKTSVSSFMGYLKGKSALMMFDKHANLKYKFGNRHFWAEGYYVSTVGLNESTIRKIVSLSTVAPSTISSLTLVRLRSAILSFHSPPLTLKRRGISLVLDTMEKVRSYSAVTS